MRKIFWTLSALLLSAGPALATGLTPDPAIGQPIPKGMDLQTAASPVKEMMHEFHSQELLIMCFGISIFVLALLLWVMARYNKWTNPKPSQTTHNTVLEVIWTAVPIIILIIIAIPSFKLLYVADRTPATEMTLKVTGHQWYWSYVYPDHNGVALTAYPKKDSELKPGEPRLLETDNRVVVPVNTNIKVEVTAADVLHSFALPAFGVKKDAIPGRLNETWFKATRTGVFYGQCSEICGTGHAYMPIAIEVVEKAAFDGWIAEQQKAQDLVPVAAPAAAEAAPAAKPAL